MAIFLRVIKWGGLLLVVAVTVVYWQDPWLWRNTVRFFASGDPTSVERLLPDEEITGDGSYVLPTAPPAELTVDPAALAAMQDYAAEFGSHALIVVHKGVIQTEWYADHWTATDLTQSQSMHKTLMAVFVGMAIADGLIASVDEPIGRWITEWADDPRGDITLRNLLQMSSGLAEYGFKLNPFSDDLKWLNSGRSIEPILRTPLADWEQGTRWSYNDINAELLGIIVQRVFGMRYSEVLQQRLWQPMGGERARVHTDSPGGRAYTSCCLAAPAMDWVRVGMLLLQDGVVNGRRLLPADWVAAMRTPSPAGSHYGYQVWLGYDDEPLGTGATDGRVGSSGAVATEPFTARDTWLLLGRGQQHVFIVPSAELVIVRLGPALGMQPIKPGFDVPRLPNLAVAGLRD
ncbi:MAG: serine hydrolase [Gammaproteobacteria bacterium]|jgi:CubicO group peptidase (beta-lactamase class C family)|nr:serine hydrolase [Gammaproteobacteria bacterium]